MSDTAPISLLDFQNGCDAFQQRERRDAMYKIACILVSQFWNDPSQLANSLGVLLLTWNSAFYRYGSFDFDKLEACISINRSNLDEYRLRDILTYSSSDNGKMTHLFENFHDALAICEGKKSGTKSRVSVAKALHLLAPSFFPLWDDKIARAYKCSGHGASDDYIAFTIRMKQIAQYLQPQVDLQQTEKTLLKLIDEYNYSKYTKEWI